MNRTRGEYGLALLLDLLGAAAALLISTRIWQTIVTPRPRPLADDVLDVTGRTVDAAPTALALVALAGVVAVLATSGLARRVVGAALVLAGVGLVWRSVSAASAVGAGRARELVVNRHSGVGLEPGVVPTVTVHGAWALLSVACGVLIAVAGLLVVLRGHRWAGLSARYSSPGAAGDRLDEQTRQARAGNELWSALDRGDDPTVDPAPAGGPDSGTQPSREPGDPTA